MDNNTYETYEYFPTNNSEPETNQFFVVQDDGTFLITQVQDDKEALEEKQSCTVYDITPSQQFFVDVENSTELISVPENLILPDVTSNLYANNYILQTISTTDSDQVKEDDVAQYGETEVQKIILGSNESNQANHCTEITLNDEQYNMLKQKGWVLLETSDKIFILDSSGLHDITDNQELIEQLKTENPNVHTIVDPRSIIKIENVSSMIKFDSIATKTTASEQDTVEYVIGNEDVVQNIDSASKVNSMEVSSTEVEDIEEKHKEGKTKNIEEKKLSNKGKEKQTIKIKTKSTFRDIPDKIVLGKTVNGKNLVAKVIRLKKEDAKKCDSDNINQTQPEVNPQKSAKDVQMESENTHRIEWQFDSLVQQTLHNAGDMSERNPQFLATAKCAINQLLRVPAFQHAVVDRNIFVTKLVKNKLENVKFHVQSETIVPTIVTGRVECIDGEKQFVHIPDLLQKLKAESEKANTEKRLADPNSDEFSVLHVHITETKTAGSTEGFSINLHKRQLPFMPIKTTPSKRQCSKVYACSSCAKVFQSEQELLEHQENHCMEFEDALTIDTDNLVDDSVTNTNEYKINPYYIIKSTKGMEYACLRCFMRFKKLSNCQKHIKIHAKSMNLEGSDGDISKLKPTYKCKMCTSSYFHPSTLSKHIVAAHIKCKTELNKPTLK